MRAALIMAGFALAITVGCAVAIGEGATSCLDIDSRSALVLDTAAASAPEQQKSLTRGLDPTGVACHGGGSNK